MQKCKNNFFVYTVPFDRSISGCEIVHASADGGNHEQEQDLFLVSPRDGQQHSQEDINEQRERDDRKPDPPPLCCGAIQHGVNRERIRQRKQNGIRICLLFLTAHPTAQGPRAGQKHVLVHHRKLLITYIGSNSANTIHVEAV